VSRERQIQYYLALSHYSLVTTSCKPCRASTLRLFTTTHGKRIWEFHSERSISRPLLLPYNFIPAPHHPPQRGHSHHPRSLSYRPNLANPHTPPKNTSFLRT
jgi:hypothetical protein